MVDGGAGWTFVLVRSWFGAVGLLGWGLAHEAGNRSTQRRDQASSPLNLTPRRCRSVPRDRCQGQTGLPSRTPQGGDVPLNDLRCQIGGMAGTTSGGAAPLADLTGPAGRWSWLPCRL